MLKFVLYCLVRRKVLKSFVNFLMHIRYVMHANIFYYTFVSCTRACDTTYTYNEECRKEKLHRSAAVDSEKKNVRINISRNCRIIFIPL